jgi:hypothetical protein
MTASRAAAYCGGGLLLLAGLSYAGGPSRQPAPAQDSVRPVETTGTASLAADVQAQTSRLKERLAVAPAPQEPSRNPFAFAPREVETRRPRRAAPAVDAAPAAPIYPAEPAIELVGVAESQTPSGVVRTAVISALNGELFLVKEGELIATRYRVKSVGPSAVELSDLVSGAVRRLALRE